MLPVCGDVSDEELDPSAPPVNDTMTDACLAPEIDESAYLPRIRCENDINSWLVARPSPSESLPRVSYSEIGRWRVNIFFTSESVLPRLSDSENDQMTSCLCTALKLHAYEFGCVQLSSSNGPQRTQI